jgi:hypothetical protein
MAKIIMKCPFSEKICAECAIYRGRHYCLCFANKYRGHIDSPVNGNTATPFHIDPHPRFSIPLIIPDRSIDPFNDDYPSEDNSGK